MRIQSFNVAATIKMHHNASKYHISHANELLCGSRHQWTKNPQTEIHPFVVDRPLNLDTDKVCGRCLKSALNRGLIVKVPTKEGAKETDLLSKIEKDARHRERSTKKYEEQKSQHECERVKTDNQKFAEEIKRLNEEIKRLNRELQDVDYEKCVFQTQIEELTNEYRKLEMKHLDYKSKIADFMVALMEKSFNV